MKFSHQRLERYGKPLLFLVALAPAAWLVHEWYQAYSFLPHGLGFNPEETSNRFTGDWTLRFLLLTLMITPLAKLLKSPKPILFRRMLGLFTFFYACLHITSYLWLDLLLNWWELWSDILKRVYITIGMAAFLMLFPLAVTSTKGWIRRLGARRWQRLHRSIYLIAPLAIVHFVMMRKGLQVEPLVYGFILAILLLFRLKRVQKWLDGAIRA